MKNIFKNRINGVMLIGFPLITIGTILFYLSANYQNLDNRIESVKIGLSKPIRSDALVIYISDSTDAAIDFTEHYFAQSINDSTLLIDLGRKIKLRQFRLYFQRAMEDVTINEISLLSEGYKHTSDLKKLKSEDIRVITNNGERLTFSVLLNSGYAYFESPQFYYPEDYTLLLLAILGAVGLSCLLYLFMREINSIVNLNSLTLQELSVIAFILSVFLPQAFFNITLTISALLVIRNFRIDYFLTNRLNLLFILFYSVILLNFIFFIPTFNFTIIEKYTSLLFLPIYVSCIKSTRLLIFFSLSAFLIGGCVLVGALINIAIFKNPEIISFDNLTGEIHPVYYSYLLAFSVIYIECGTNLRYKYLINFLLFLLLVLSGSKLIIFGLLLLLPFFFKKSIKMIFVPLMIVALFLFAPLRERFVSILRLSDLSIVSEEHIENPDDKRLNGVTLRIILWQENLRVDNTIQFIFGRGIGRTGDDILEDNLGKRGLTKHLWYNAHNQYVTTFFHTGMIGLIALLSILFYCIRLGVRSKDQVLLFFSIITFLAMMSESVFERASGIVFFGLIILLITNAKQLKSGHTQSS